MVHASLTARLCQKHLAHLRLEPVLFWFCRWRMRLMDIVDGSPCCSICGAVHGVPFVNVCSVRSLCVLAQHGLAKHDRQVAEGALSAKLRLCCSDASLRAARVEVSGLF